ncbi:MAG: GGDEF domain-containing protein [Agromyces sp.]
MTIDLYTIQLAMTTVVIVAGVMFVLDTFLRKTDEAGRVWAVSFMAGILAAFAYSTWAIVPDAWWAVAVGNAAMVLSTALLWCGARAYNGRPDLVWTAVIAAGAAGIAVLVEGPDGGDWAGAVVMFVLIAGFATLGAVESVRAPMRENWTARGLTVMFVVVGLFYSARAVVFLALGPEHPWFTSMLGTEASAFVLISLVIVAVVSLVILQSERVVGSPSRRELTPSYTADAVLNAASFRDVVEDWLERANYHDEQLVFMRVELDELSALNTAFGRSVGSELLAQFTAAVRRHCSPHSDIGIAGPGVLVVVAPFAALEDAEENAALVQSGLREDRLEAAQGLRLSASIGLAGSDLLGYDFDRLMSAATDAAAEARAKGGDAVAIAA